MDVSGRRPPAGKDVASAEDYDVYCSPCDQDGKRSPGYGYCESCEDYLCETCYKCHTVPRPLRHHVLLDKSHMPKSARQLKSKDKSSKCTIACAKHSDNVVEFYCPDHSTSVCGVCAVLSHKSCDVEYISDISQNYGNSQEYANFKVCISQLENDATVCMNSTTSNAKDSKTSNQKAIDEIKKFRTKFDTYFDEKERELLMLAKKMQTDNETDTNDLTIEYNEILSDAKQVRTSLTNRENTNNDLFVTAKEMMNRVTDLKGRLQIAAAKNIRHRYNFTPDKTLADILSFKTPIGKLDQTRNVNKPQEDITQQNVNKPEILMKEKATDIKVIPKQDNIKQHAHTHVPSLQKATSSMRISLVSAQVSRLPDINAKSPDDEISSITGLTLLSPDRLLLVDHNDSNIKTVNITTNTIVSQLKLSSKPWDVTTVDNDQVAVTLPYERKIQIISTSSGLSPVREVRVNGWCHVIDSTTDTFIVSYTLPCKVEIINHKGGLLQTFSMDVHGKPLFQLPYYVKVINNKDKEVIWVSDYHTHTITQLSMKGDVISKYTDQDMKNPRGLDVTEEGDLLVCNFGSHNVQLVSQSGQKIRTLLDQTSGIDSPNSVSYCPNQHIIFVGSSYTNVIQQFKMS